MYEHLEWYTTMSVGKPTQGSISSEDDKDWYSIQQLDGGLTYHINVDDWNGQAILEDLSVLVHMQGGYDTLGTGTPVGDVVPYASGLAFTAPATATYFIAVAPRGATTGPYTLSINADYAADLSTSGEVIVRSSTENVVETRLDQDWFRVSLLAGQEYPIDLEGVPSVHGTLPDPYLHGIYNAEGELVSGTTNDDVDVAAGNLNSRVVFTPVVSGEYYVAAGGYGATTGSYKLSVQGHDDYAGDPSTAGRVDEQGSARGGVQTVGDHDWFRVALEANQIYRIDLDAYHADHDALSDPYLLGVHNSDGQLLPKTTNDDGGQGLNASLLFVPEESADYFIGVSGLGVSTGTYELSVEPDYSLV